MACLAIKATSFVFSFANTGMFKLPPTTLSCFIAAGLYTSHATNSGFLPCFLSKFASLPAVVVLPEPLESYHHNNCWWVWSKIDFTLSTT